MHAHLRKQTVLVLGLGESGLAMARWVAAAGARVRVWDSREQPPHAAALAEHVPAAELFTGVLDEAVTAGVQLVLKSPGLSPLDKRIAGPLDALAERGVLVLGELALFASALAELKATRGYAPRVLAITGTNGKTTTTALTALLVEATGKRVAVAGNIGPTLLQTLADALLLEPAPAPVRAPSEDDAPAAEAAVLPTVPSAPPAEAHNTALADVAADAGADAHTCAEMDAAETGTEAEADADTDNSVLTEPVADALATGPAGSPEALLPPDETAEATGGGPPPHLVPPPPAGPVFQHLPEVWVLELSSFQLDECKTFEPDAATVLNISQDHLDWHGSLAAYSAAKTRIFGRQATMVVNRNDPAVEAMVPQPPDLGALSKTARARAPRFQPRQVLRFGLDAPQRPGDFGLVSSNGVAWLVRAQPAEDLPVRGKRGAAVDAEDLVIQRLMPAEALRIRGRHNAANALAALALASAIGCPLAPMLHALREYRGEPHRVELVAMVGGVEAFDDSKGTNVGATVAALDGLGADRQPARLVVLLGGDGKGQDFSPLLRPVQQHARAVATLGRDAAEIEAALADAGVLMARHATLEAATRWAFAQALPGDALLLSPACASLDMFRNYAHRAQVFVDEVKAIAADRGELLS